MEPRSSHPTTLVFQSRIPASPEEVFAFHERPDAFYLLTPWWSGAHVETPAPNLLPGARAVLLLGFGPFAQRWEAVHVSYDPPRSFEEHQASGPFISWRHRHIVMPDGIGGALLRDELTYEAPGGPLAPLANLLLRPFLTALFRFRHTVTRRETVLASPGQMAPAAS